MRLAGEKMKEFLQIQDLLIERLNQTGQMNENQIQEIIDEVVLEEGKKKCFTVREKQKLSRELFCSVRKLDVLEEALEDPTVTEIMVNGFQNIFLERHGKTERWDKQFSSAEKLDDVIQQIVGQCNRAVNEQNPIVDARLADGSRVNVVMKPVALNGPILTIRRFPEEAVTMQDLIAWGSITEEAAEFLKTLVENRYSILISGGTSTGKTTFLNALSGFIPPDERIITIEDSAELMIQGIDNLVRLETKTATIEGGTEITIRDLIRTALRMRPARIIVGEVRGGEAADLLNVLNTGHPGSFSTLHANSSRDMISRLETMVLMGITIPLEAIRHQIVSGVNIIIQLERDREGRRKVLEITEILGLENGEIQVQNIFERPQNGELERVRELYRSEQICVSGV